MTVRVYRKRLGFLAILLISICLYFNRSFKENSKNEFVQKKVVEIIQGREWIKIDWHDYTLIERENSRIGEGEND